MWSWVSVRQQLPLSLSGNSVRFNFFFLRADASNGRCTGTTLRMWRSDHRKQSLLFLIPEKTTQTFLTLPAGAVSVLVPQYVFPQTTISVRILTLTLLLDRRRAAKRVTLPVQQLLLGVGREILLECSEIHVCATAVYSSSYVSLCTFVPVNQVN